MSEHWTDRLSEYVDGELPEGEASRLEAHLRSCRECETALAELRAVVEAAAGLEDAAPERDLWPGIAARLTPRTAEGVTPKVVPIGRASRRPRRRVMLTVPQLVAAGIALMLLSAGVVWLGVGAAGPGAVAAGPVAETEAPARGTPVALASTWESAVADLEAEFERRQSMLDAETIQVVERNLAIIDEAIAEARRALEADPSSGFLNGHLAEAMRRKVDLLRQATRIQRTET